MSSLCLEAVVSILATWLIRSVVAPPFKAWVPDDNEVICAKPEIYYENRCFKPKIDKRFTRLKTRFKGAKKLQVMCIGIIRTIGECLKWFNDLCSKDYLQTGQGDFTAATTSGMSRKALREFKEQWDSKGNGNLDLYKCTAYGGLCEHPQQLQYCKGQRCVKSSLFVVIIALLFQIIIT